VRSAGPAAGEVALFLVGGAGDVDLFLEDNLAVDVIGEATVPEVGRYATAPVKVNRLRSAPPLPFGVRLLTSAQVQNSVIEKAGATPWNRDPIDRRIVADVVEG